MEKQGELTSLWKLQEYYAVANQFGKMILVMAQIKTKMQSLKHSNDKPDDVIEINSEEVMMMNLITVIQKTMMMLI